MIKFKHEDLYKEFLLNKVHSELRMLAVVIDNMVPVGITITGVLGEKGIKRKSKSHEEGRAFDIRTRTWTEDAIFRRVRLINKTFSTGLFHKDGSPMFVAVYHDSGYGLHLHIQIPKGRPLIIHTESGDILI